MAGRICPPLGEAPGDADPICPGRTQQTVYLARNPPAILCTGAPQLQKTLGDLTRLERGRCVQGWAAPGLHQGSPCRCRRAVSCGRSPQGASSIAGASGKQEFRASPRPGRARARPLVNLWLVAHKISPDREQSTQVFVVTRRMNFSRNVFALLPFPSPEWTRCRIRGLLSGQ